MRSDVIPLWMKHGRSTMCNASVFEANIELAEQVTHVSGDVVECGVWRGGMIAAIAETLGPDRQYALYDSFQGLPPAQPIDGQAALDWQAKDPNNCRATMAEAEKSMRMSGVPNWEIYGGWFTETLTSPRLGPDRIALLRLDADWYDSTMCCLTNLWNRVVPGGVIIVDDYYVWDGCSRAVHVFLSMMGAAERIREHEGVAYIVRRQY